MLFPFLANAREERHLISNFKNFRELEAEVTEAPLEQDVYDLSFVAYDKDFAEEFGLIADNVTDMDEHLRFIEVRMVTEGQKTNCYYNVILDKLVELDFPDRNYTLADHPRMNYPWAYQKDGVSLETMKTRKNLTGVSHEKNLPFTNKTYLGNRGYTFNIKGKPFSNGSAFDVSVASYIQDRDINYNIISTSRFCGGANIYWHPEPAFWVRKKNTNEASSLPQSENYHTFEIPKTIVDKFRPILVEYIKLERSKIQKSLERNNDS